MNKKKTTASKVVDRSTRVTGEYDNLPNKKPVPPKKKGYTASQDQL